MTFEASTLFPASNRFQLVRITPARCVNDLVADIGGGQYTVTLNEHIAKVELNGVPLTRVSAPYDNQQYSWDEDSGLITMQLTEAPSATDIINVFYDLFFTGEVTRGALSTPDYSLVYDTTAYSDALAAVSYGGDDVAKYVSAFEDNLTGHNFQHWDVAWAPSLGLFASPSSNGSGTQIMTSPDGKTWTARSSANSNAWRGIAWAEDLGLFACVSTSGSGNRVMTSPDGINWTARSSAANAYWWDICYSEDLGLFCAVALVTAVTTLVMTSPDGINWTGRTAASTNDWRSVCWSPSLSLFCAVSDNAGTSSVMTSPDGINWTARTTTSAAWQCVAWSEELGKFVALASSGGHVMTSSNGTSWTFHSAAAASTNAWRGIVWSPEASLFLATASSGTLTRFMTSPDGTTWTTRANPVDQSFYGVTWSPDLNVFCVVSSNGTGNVAIVSKFINGILDSNVVSGVAGDHATWLKSVLNGYESHFIIQDASSVYWSFTYVGATPNADIYVDSTHVYFYNIDDTSKWIVKSSTSLTSGYAAADAADFDTTTSSGGWEAYDVEPIASNVLWYPRLASYIPTEQSISNATSGVLTYADTSITMIDADSNFEQYLTIDDSFSNKDVTVWQCIDDVETNQKVYHGKMKNISIANGVIKMNVYDPFTKLDDNAYMGDDFDEAHAINGVSPWDSMQEADHKKPFPFIFGHSSPHDLLEQAAAFAAPVTYVMQPDSLYRAICTSYTRSTPTTSNNREHYLCRVSSEGLRSTLNFGTTVRYTTNGGTIGAYMLTGHNLKVGDKFYLPSSSSCATVMYVGDFSYGGSPYNVELLADGAFTFPSNLAAGATAHSAPIVWLLDKDGVLRPMYPTIDYTWTTTTTSAGNKNIVITMTNNCTPEVDMSRAYDPKVDRIVYLVRPAKEHTHSEALQALIESSGLDVNAASFTQADSDIDANAFFTVPFKGEDEYSPLRKYVEAVTRSTLGYVKVNTDIEVEYHILAAPSSTDVVDVTHYDSVSITMDYGDIIHEISAQNSHATTIATQTGSSINTSYLKATNLRAKYLHGIDKTENFEHVLETMENTLDNILTIKSGRRCTYSFSTATINLASEIGDDILFTSDRIAGANGITTASLKITSLSKDGHTTEIEADDLGEL